MSFLLGNYHQLRWYGCLLLIVMQDRLFRVYYCYDVCVARYLLNRVQQLFHNRGFQHCRLIKIKDNQYISSHFFHQIFNLLLFSRRSWSTEAINMSASLIRSVVIACISSGGSITKYVIKKK